MCAAGGYLKNHMKKSTSLYITAVVKLTFYSVNIYISKTLNSSVRGALAQLTTLSEREFKKWECDI